MKKELMRIDNIKKGNVLKWIQLQIFEGEIIHCVFNNVQEKSLFLDIITGRSRADFGKLYCDEQEVPEERMLVLFEKYAAAISGKSTLIESVTILENLFLIRGEVKEQWARYREYRQKAEQVLRKFNVDIDISMPTEKLSSFEKIQLEIIKGYLLEKRILILTAISNTLSNNENKVLWALIEKLKDMGISCIIAEPLEDISFLHTDRVVIIKDGKTCAVKDIDECDYTMLHTILYRYNITRSDEREIMTVDTDNEGKIQLEQIDNGFLKNISISVTKGEVVKLFCVDERSYEQITGFFRGRIKVNRGRIKTDGSAREIRKTIHGVKDGIGVLEGNPVTQLLFMDLTAMDNLQMLLSQKANGIWLQPKYKKSIQLLLKGILDEDVYSKEMKNLTNSEVQKIAYCRWLIYSPELLVCIQPFADGDIQARETAREMIYLLEKRNIPILIITSNTLEFNYCRGKEIYIRRGKVISKEEAYDTLHSGNRS